MSSESPLSSPPQTQYTKRDGLASDANIRNFAPVARIMKGALPENAKIAKEAKECMQECVSEFISFITSEGKFVLNPLSANSLAERLMFALFQRRRSVSRKSARLSMEKTFSLR